MIPAPSPRSRRARMREELWNEWQAAIDRLHRAADAHAYAADDDLVHREYACARAEVGRIVQMARAHRLTAPPAAVISEHHASDDFPWALYVAVSAFLTLAVLFGW